MPRFKITWGEKQVRLGLHRYLVLVAGFLEGVDFCDSQLKHCIHNFIRWK